MTDAVKYSSPRGPDGAASAWAAQFQPSDGAWSDYAALPGLQSVLDPRDKAGLKNRYIDALHKRAILSALPRRRGVRALDYGCGSGRITRFLASRVESVIGVDVTPEMLQAAAAEGGPGKIDYRLLSSPTLPCESDSLDVVVSVYVLQYVAPLREHYERLLTEFSRVLNPGGVAIFVEQAAPAGGKSGSLRHAVSPGDYLEPLKRAEFSVRRPRVIRLGSPTPWELRTSLNSLFPAPLKPAAEAWTYWMNARIAPRRLARQCYVDYLIVGRRNLAGA